MADGRDGTGYFVTHHGGFGMDIRIEAFVDQDIGKVEARGFYLYDQLFGFKSGIS